MIRVTVRVAGVGGTGGTVRPLAVTMGDPAGIGFDILLAALQRSGATPMPPLVVYGCPATFRARAAQLGTHLDCVEIAVPGDVVGLGAGQIGVIPVPCSVPVTAGQPDPRNGQAVITAIECAVADVSAGQAGGVVTCPIAKATLYASGFRHPGHTEFLAVLAARHAPGHAFKPVMMLAAAELRVVPLTIHVPLADVPRLLTQELIVETVRITAAALTGDFGIAKPRIAVAGLNPHAGESGTIGREETTVIGPALAALKAEGLDVIGPLSADTMFHAAARARYDAAIAMYHDQALIPIKTLAFDRGVNVTLGLPFVRTSPDHGTAFDIAGSGRADATSFIEAVQLAGMLAARRLAASATP